MGESNTFNGVIIICFIIIAEMGPGYKINKVSNFTVQPNSNWLLNLDSVGRFPIITQFSNFLFFSVLDDKVICTKTVIIYVEIMLNSEIML